MTFINDVLQALTFIQTNNYIRAMIMIKADKVNKRKNIERRRYYKR